LLGQLGDLPMNGGGAGLGFLQRQALDQALEIRLHPPLALIRARLAH
jgi:hypothetical protein